MANDDSTRELTREERAALAQRAVGRGVLRIRDRGVEVTVWSWRWPIRLIRWGGGVGTFFAVSWLVPIPIARYVLGAIFGWLSLGVWTGVAVLVLTALGGIGKRPSSDAGS